MSLPPNKFREIVFQALFSTGEEEGLVPLLMKERKVTRKAVKQGLERAAAIRAITADLDEVIEKSSASYPIERIQKVELCILRLGAYEILHDEAIPPKVAIDEAVRLTRKFSTREATAFVNAVLDHIYHGGASSPVEEAAESLQASEEAAREGEGSKEH